MLTAIRFRHVTVGVVTSLLSAAAAIAQPVQDVSQPESSEMTALLVVFCAVVIGLLAHTARRMATLR